jgi:hypothetical protein
MPAVIATPVTSIQSGSYVEWGAVFAGAVTAIAASLVLLTFGAAIGLTAISPWTATSASLKAVGLGAALWFLLVTLWSFALGGYLAGRLRHKWADATASEMAFRDAGHGLLVWAVAVLFGAVMAAVGVSAAGGGLLVAASNAPAALDPTTVATDSLLRVNKPGQTIAPEVRQEVTRILMRSGKKGGLKEALDRARRVGILLGFLTGATLLVGAATAWWAAKVGGRHREEGTIWAGLA